jgi:Putative DNA-binding domain
LGERRHPGTRVGKETLRRHRLRAESRPIWYVIVPFDQRRDRERVGGVSGAAAVSVRSTFASALLNPGQPIPVGLGAAAADARRRFAVHRNNMVAGLINTLAARFPAVAKIAGGEFFNAMARAFVLAHPPRSPLLACYGDELPDFIGGFARAREVAYLADVVRIEAARTRAYHAVDAAPVGADAFAALTVEAASTMRPVDHSLPHPIVPIWAMNSGERGLAPIEDWRREDALVARPLLEVEVRVLPPGVSEFLLALAAGRPLGEAALHALAACPQFNLTNNVAGLIGCGLACRIIPAAPNGR